MGLYPGIATNVSPRGRVNLNGLRVRKATDGVGIWGLTLPSDVS